jgi:hypothetical protein
MARTSNVRRVFLSYSHADRAEAQQLYRELRRRGVPVWYDAADLPRGRVTRVELTRAARDAAGFAFYLTENAARSDWVREEERARALENQALDQSFGVFPVFRQDLARLTELMQAEAQDRRNLAAYDLRHFHGFVIDERATGAELAEELRRAATEVLRSLLGSLADRSDDGAALRVGAATREGPKTREHPLDLLVDWTQDFPDVHGNGTYPSPEAAEQLLRALEDLRGSILHEWPGQTIRIVPHCHLSMALALGFLFRRNSGFALQVVNPYDGETWRGPEHPLAGTSGFWSISEDPQLAGRGDEGLALIVGVSRPIGERTRAAVVQQGLSTHKALLAEPASGASLESMSSLAGDDGHRVARALVDRLSEERARGVRGPLHLVYAGPAHFAVLLGQQLSNLGGIHVYEWKESTAELIPVFVLHSS